MNKVLIFLVAAFAVCASQPSRHGSFNSYYVYTREHSRTPVPLTIDTIAASPILASRRTIIIVHGHQGTGFTSLNPTLKDAFLTSADLNIIVVDWSIYASLSYSNAVGAVPGVADHLTTLAKELVTATRVNLNNLHLVGFDLGAHIVGFTGRLLGGQVARITGLNPSGSQWSSSSQRLRSTDALYVEVIHTDGGLLLSNGIGESLGDVDFFVNGGNNQPGCYLKNDCSHNRAWELFAASLTHDHLKGNRCQTTLQVSMNTCRGFTLALGNNELIKFGSGLFRVNTGRTYPY